MKGTGWISWISKQACFCLLILISCSSPRTSSPPAAPQVNPEPPPNLILGATAPNPRFFTDHAEVFGLASVPATSWAAVDVDHDGYTDLAAIENNLSLPVFFRYLPKKKRFEKMSPSPLLARPLVSGLLFADMNRDGVPDLITYRLNSADNLTAEPVRVHLAQKQKGHWVYQEVPKALTADPGPVSSVVPLDLDTDGNLDLAVIQWYGLSQGLMRPYPAYTTLGKSDGTFAKPIPLPGESFPGLGGSSCDMDFDGRPDLLVANSNGTANQLWINKYPLMKDLGDATGFASDGRGASSLGDAGNSSFALCADYNNDKIMDVAVGEKVTPFDNTNRDRSAILTGSSYQFPYKFVRTEFEFDDERSRAGYFHRQGLWADVDNDGLQDLLVDDNGTPPHSRLIFLHQGPSHELVDEAAEWGLNILNPAGTLAIDLNRDGALDILTSQTSTRVPGMKPRTYAFIQNTHAHPVGSSLVVRLKGKKSNRQGLGATLRLKSDKGTQIRFVSGLEVRFGLADKTRLLELEVTWPGINKKQLVPLSSFKGKILNVQQ